MTTDSEKKRQRDWHFEHDEPKGTIGDVPRLAPGAINPMWSISRGIEKMAQLGADALNITKPIHSKKVVVNAKKGSPKEAEATMDIPEEIE